MTSADREPDQRAPAREAERQRQLLALLERYYDVVPRSAARVEDFGPLTLFVREGGGYPFYGRPSPGWSGEFDAADVSRLRARQRELGAPESLEWVAEVTPGLRAAVKETGLVVHEHPLMVLGPEAPTPAVAERDDGVVVRRIGSDDALLPSALAVPHLAFAEPGTQVGPAGVADLAKVAQGLVAEDAVGRMSARIRAGLASVAAAVENGQALCAGWHQPVGEVSEIVGMGTLPTERRRGLALAVTASLVADARSMGVRTVFLSASDDKVARIYSRLGFRRVGTALIAEPAE